MKKGFTLIELLAVIVVLAILALVVTPIVLNIVENAQRGSDERSLEQYAKVMQSTYYELKMHDPSLTLEEYLDTVDTVSGVSLTYNGSKVICSERKVVETVSGTQTIELRNCTVDGRGPYDFINGSAGKKNNSATSSVVKYTIKTTLSKGVKISNSATTIKHGESYSATLTPITGYELKSINITMGGKDITSSVCANGKITIEKVTGNIEITTSVISIYTIKTTLSNVTISNSVTSIKHGESYSATLTPKDGYGLKSINITMGGKDITSSVYANGKITIEKVTGNVVITVTVATQFSIDSWSTIIANVKSGNTSAYKVGDTKEISLTGFTNGEKNSNGLYTVRIANKSTLEECSTEGFSQTACGFVIEFVDIISEHVMNTSDTAVGGWPASAMYAYVNNNIYNSLPDELKAGIIDTYVVSGYGENDSPNKTSTDKLYLLSYKEVYGITDESNTESSLTRQLDYYKNLGVTNKNNYSKAIKKYNGSSDDWWLRSITFNYYDRFLWVDDEGECWIVYPNNNGGVSPAFRIG